MLRCEVCQSLLDEEDLFCANCGTEAPGRAEQSAAAADTARVATHNFECAGCGASMSYDAGAGSLRCPFCGSVEMDQHEDARVLAPRRVVPFVLTQQQAVDAMRRWLGRGFFRPGDLAREAAVVCMTAVYVPYWVFQATTHTYWTADTSQTPPGARGNWYPLSGEHHGAYAGVLVGASGALSPAETSAIGPFDLGAGIPPEEVDLEGVIVEQFGLARKYARPFARQAVEQLEATEVDRRYVPGRSRNVHVNVRIEGLSSEPVLLPAWIMTYRYQERVYRFLVNGQTGKATGEAPFSWPKLLLVVAIVLAAILLVLLVCSGVLGGAMMVSQTEMPTSLCDGVLDARAKILLLQVGVVIPDDLGKREPLTNQLQNALHGNSRPCHTRLPEVDLWVDRDSLFHGCCFVSWGQLRRGHAASLQDILLSPAMPVNRSAQPLCGGAPGTSARAIDPQNANAARAP